jgi:hypothetical protein
MPPEHQRISKALQIREVLQGFFEVPKAPGVFDCNQMVGLNAQAWEFTQSNQHGGAGWTKVQRVIPKEAITERSDENTLERLIG